MATGSVGRNSTRVARKAALAGATLTAAALTAAVTPPAAPAPTRSLDIALAASATESPQPAFGIGPVGGLLTPLLNVAKMNPVELAGLVSYQFSGGAPTTRSIYDLLNDLDYTPVQDITGNTCRSASQTGCRTAFVFSTGFGSLGTTDTIHALLESALGKTRPGFDPLKITTGTGLTQTSVYYINNMLRPNGGIAARFPDLMKLFGLNPAMPAVGETGPNKDGSSVYNWITDITWPYNTFADFPITANPFSLLNSAFAIIPPKKLIDEVMSPGDAQAKLLAVLADTAGTLSSGAGTPIFLPPALQCKTSCTGYAGPGFQVLLGPIAGQLPGPDGLPAQYLMTAGSNAAIPITYPTYILSSLLNPVLKKVNSPYLLGTAMADILTPAMKILVNIGYDDVITPDKLNTVDPTSQADPKLTYAQENYTAYDRTFVQSTPGTPTPFAWFKNPAMTPEQTKTAYSDAGKAFIGALQAQAKKPFFGIVVPNPANPPKEVNRDAAAEAPAPVAAVAAPAATEAAPPEVDPAPASVAAKAVTGASAAKVTKAKARAPRAAAAAGDSSAADKSHSNGPARRGAR